VGFISDLPTELVAAFRATLEEVLSADLVVHVRDISHPETEEQAADVRAILEDLGVDPAVPVLEVWNKIDRLPPEERAAAEARAARDAHVFAVSALTGEGLEALKAAMASALEGERREAHLHLDFSQGRERAWLHEEGVVVAERQDEDGFDIKVRWTPRQAAEFARLGTEGSGPAHPPA
jgi:GTP-binding protein HflX